MVATYYTNPSDMISSGLQAYDIETGAIVGRTITAGSSKISVADGVGTGGNPTIDAVEANFDINNLGGTLGVPKGGTGAVTLRDHGILLGSGVSAISVTAAPTDGQLLIGSTGADPVLGTLTDPAAGLTTTLGAGSITLALANDLAALEGLASTGIAVRSAIDTWVQRTITAGAGITVTDGDGVSGNPTVAITSPVSVSLGGTGRHIADPYLVICGGTTTTSAHQSIASLGDAGYVLTSNGAGALPSMQAPSGGSGGWVLIETQTVSTPVATVDFDTGIDGTYRDYVFLFKYLVPSGVSRNLYVRVGTGATPTYQTGGVYNNAYSAGATRDDHYSKTGIKLGGTIGTDTNDWGYSGNLWLYEPANTVHYTHMAGCGCAISGSISQMYNFSYAGQYNAATAVTAFRFYYDIGNIESGTISLYGVPS